jgi:ankyrin repeat protein
VKIKELIEKDTSQLNLKDPGGRTPFHWAAANGNIEIASYLLSKGSNINNKNTSQSTPLHAAASMNNPKMAAWLLEHGSEVDPENTMGWTPLFWAARVGRKELIELLLNKGANLNAIDPMGLTPLNVALIEGNKESLDILMDKGATIDMTGNKGIDILQLSAEKGFVRVFNVVIEKGGQDLFSDATCNRTTMNKAISGGSVEIVKALVGKGIPLELKADMYGWTPIHFAADGGKVTMLEYLVKKGVDINLRTNDGKSAYNIAAAKNNSEMMSAIIKLSGILDSQKFPVLKGLYLGQKPPGITPIMFAPGIISTASHEFSTCFSPDGKEIYYARRIPELRDQAVIMVSKLVNGSWTEPTIAPFVNNEFTYEPFVTPDNKRLYFQCGRVIGGALQMFTLYVDRTENGWSEIKDPGDPFNPMKTMHISVTNNGTIYTTDISGGGSFRTNAGPTNQGSECLGLLKAVNGKYDKIEKLGPPLNKYPNSQHPWIAPDESYILYTVAESGQQGKSRIYFSEKGKDCNWAEPKEVHLGINGGQPFVTPDGKYLFFTSFNHGQGDLYWVSTKILDGLRQKK